VILELLTSAVVLAGAPEPASVYEVRGRLAGRLIEHIHLRVALGDGRGAARAFPLLAAASGDPDSLAEIAFLLLDLYPNHGLPADIRSRLISDDADARHKAVAAVAARLDAMTGERPLPERWAGWRVLGPDDGCPVTAVRSFVPGADGAIGLLGDGLAFFDGRRWQVIGPDALRVHRPARAAFVDREGRTWLGSTAGGGRGSTLMDRLRGQNWRPLACFKPAGEGLMPRRWYVYDAAGGITDFAETRDGIWIAGRSRLFRVVGRRALPINAPLPYSPIRRLIGRSDSDQLWVIDADRVSCRDSGRWISLRLGELRPRNVAQGPEGRPLVVLASGLLSPGKTESVLIPAPEGYGGLTAAAVDGDGNAWCVTDTGCLLRADLKATASAPLEASWTCHKAPGPLAPRWAPTIFRDRAGRVWLSRGRGIEVSVGWVAGGATARTKLKKLGLKPARLVGVAGSGGWLEVHARLDLPGEEARAQAKEQAADLFGFEKGQLATPDDAADLLKKLREDPSAAAVFSRLMMRLRSQPDPDVRREALALAAGGSNREFTSNADHVREYAENELDAGRPGVAAWFLLHTWQRRHTESFRRQIEDPLFEALVRIGFGEFARPALLDVDLRWPVPPGPARKKGASAAPKLRWPVFLHDVRLPLDPDVGRAQSRDAGLHKAVLLADKRAVLGAPTEVRRWRQLIEDCVRVGDADAARRYARLAGQIFEDTAELERLAASVEGKERAPADSISLSPFRWIRRVDLEGDSGLGPVAGGDGAVYVLDEAASTLIALVGRDLGGGPVQRVPMGAEDARAVLADERGVVVVTRAPGGFRVRLVRKGKAEAGREIAGLTQSFDGFSATAVRKGVFYCDDGGLTKVDLGAGEVAWRNPALVGGANWWRNLLERRLPAPDGADVFVVCGHTLYRVEAATGKILWERACGARGTPAVAGKVVVVGTVREEVWGLARATGEPVWKHLAGATPGAQMQLHDGRVCFTDGDGRVTALDAATGEFRWSRPAGLSLRTSGPADDRPTALVARCTRLVACNADGYVEFDAPTGRVLRRLDLATARPLALASGAVVIATDPDRFVGVADPAGAELAGDLLGLARAASEAKAPARAIDIARIITSYVEPSHAGAHALALGLAAEGDARKAQLLYLLAAARADPFAVETRALLRAHIEFLPRWPAAEDRVLELFARAHTARGAVRQAAEAVETLAPTRGNVAVLRTLLELQIRAGEADAARATARRLAALGLEKGGVHAALATLAEGRMEETALAIASRHVDDEKGGAGVLYLALGLSARCGLFEEAKGFLDRSAATLSLRSRAQCLAFLFGSAGVADRALARYAAPIRRDAARYRELLLKRGETLRALNRPNELQAVERRLDLLKRPTFP
jgi:hypothetical protein